MAEQDKLTVVTLPCGKGVDTATQLEALDAQAGFVVAENVRQHTKGALSKRHGYTQLFEDPGRSGDHLFAWRDSAPAVVSHSSEDGHHRVRVLGEGRTIWSRPEGLLSPCTALREPLMSTTPGDFTTPTAAPYSTRFGDMILTSIERDGAVTMAVSADGVVVATATLSNVYQARVVEQRGVLGTQALLVYNRADKAICWRIISWSGSAIGIGVESVVALPAAVNDAPAQWWDACASGDGLFVAWCNLSGGYTAIDIYELGGAYDSWSQAVAGIYCLSVGSHVDDVGARSRFLAFNNAGGDLVLRRRDNAGAFTDKVIASTLYAGISAGSLFAHGAGDVVGAFNAPAFSLAARVKDMGNVPGSGLRELVNARFLSAPFGDARAQYALVDDRGDDRMAVLVELFRAEVLYPESTGPYVRPIATVAPRLVRDYGMQPAAAVKTESGWAVPIVVGLSGLSSSVQLASFDFERKLSSESLCGVRYFSGGIVEKFDGLSVHEAAFAHRPQLAALNTDGAGNVTTANGPVGYVAVYEHVDAQGNIEQSAPSAPRTLSSTVNMKIQVVVRPLNITQRIGQGTSARVAIYRTISGGRNYYRIATVSALSNALISIEDNATDASIQSRPLLYKSPGTPNDFVDRSCPSALHPIATHQGRIVGVGDDGITLWFSNTMVSGEGVYWSEAFALPIAEDGDIVAVASLDSALAVLKNNAVFLVVGDGPTENGAPGYSVQRVPSSMGCIEPESVVVTVDGVWFRGQYGLQLLARGGSVVAAGEPVVAHLGSGVRITSAVVDDRSQCVLWTLSSGITLVYDQTNRAWYTDRVAHGAVASAPATHAAVVRGRYARLHALDASVTLESDGYSDATGIAGGWITSSLETGWVRFSGLVGEQTIPVVYLLSRWSGAHGIAATVGYDYRPLPGSPARMYTSAEVEQVRAGRESYRCDVLTSNDARGTAVRVRIEDRPPIGGVPSAGGSWVGLVFEGSARATHARHGAKGR